MTSRLLAACLAAFSLISPQAGAAPPPPSLPPGQYLTQGGWGALDIRAPARGAQDFSLHSLGAAGQACAMRGRIEGTQARLEKAGETCLLDVAPAGGGMQVGTRTPQACAAFCGDTAEFAGNYLKPQSGCSRVAVRRRRDAFLALYRQGEYARARDTLAPVLADCGPVLFYAVEADVRNDLAVTLYHLGERRACRAVLAPMREIAESSNAELRSGFPPFDPARHLRIARHTRNNLRLCR
jgi:hypothetical protein